jgi:O-antigen/teichoic acid export membrane protein
VLGGTAVLGVAWASAQLFGARLFAQAAGFAAAVMVARALGPDAFGHYALMVIVATLLSEVPGAGLDLSAVRLSAGDWPRHPSRARGMLVVAGTTKATCGLSLLLLGVVFASPIASHALARPELALPIQCAALAGVALSMTETLMASLQAQERFGQLFQVNTLVATIKLAPVALLLALEALSLTNAMIAFVTAAYAGCGLAALYAWRAGGTALWDRDTARDLFTFSRWLILATILGVLAAGLDVLALTYLAGSAATGVYASGRTLALPLVVGGGAIGAVLLPRLSRMATRGEPIGPYLRQGSLRLTIGVAVVGSGLVAAAPLLVPLVYGVDYGEAVAVFQVLTLAYSVQIVTWPLLASLMVLDRPDVIAKISFTALCVFGTGYALVVPTFGALGAAGVLFVGSTLIGLIYVIVWCFLNKTGDVTEQDWTTVS